MCCVVWQPQISGVASIHDRVCELFYQLVGGQVDYGLEHSREHQHRRFGATHEGILKRWDDQQPVHLVCHSYGGATVWAFLNTVVGLTSFFCSFVCHFLTAFTSSIYLISLSIRHDAFNNIYTNTDSARTPTQIGLPALLASPVR